jgi:hypothetical protein
MEPHCHSSKLWSLFLATLTKICFCKKFGQFFGCQCYANKYALTAFILRLSCRHWRQCFGNTGNPNPETLRREWRLPKKNILFSGEFFFGALVARFNVWWGRPFRNSAEYRNGFPCQNSAENRVEVPRKTVSKFRGKPCRSSAENRVEVPRKTVSKFRGRKFRNSAEKSFEIPWKTVPKFRGKSFEILREKVSKFRGKKSRTSAENRDPGIWNWLSRLNVTSTKNHFPQTLSFAARSWRLYQKTKLIFGQVGQYWNMNAIGFFPSLKQRVCVCVKNILRHVAKMSLPPPSCHVKHRCVFLGNLITCPPRKWAGKCWHRKSLSGKGH